MLKTNVLAGFMSAALLVGACARSGTDDVDALKEELNGSIQETNDSVAAVNTLADQNAQDIDDLDGRVTDLETNPNTGVPQEVTDDIDDLQEDVTGVTTDVTNLGDRVTTLEGRFPQNDQDIVVDDKAAAGFDEAVPVANVEEGLAYINTRMDAQSGRIDGIDATVENLNTSLTSNLSSTIQNELTTMVNNNTLVLPPSEAFNPVGQDTAVAPTDDPADDVEEFHQARTFSDAILALRWASEIKYYPQDTGSVLYGENVTRVHDALDVLDALGYDIVNGNIAIDLHADTTVDGTALNTYIAQTVQGDTDLLTAIFTSNEFNNAVNTAVTAAPTPIASDIAVVTTDLGATGYDNVQESLESLYARVVANSTDIGTNSSDIGANTTAIGGNNTAIGANATNISNNADAIAALQAADAALQALADASGISFDNTGHAAFDNNNNTNNVQVAIEDLHEKITALGADIATIAAGGAVTNANLVTYTNNGQTTVEGALDDLYASIANVQVLANGTYIAQGQDLNVALAAIDAALNNVENNLIADHEARIAALEAIDAANRLAALESAVANAETAIGNNTTAIGANTTAIAGNTDGINTNAGAISDNATAIGTNTGNIGTNTADIAALEAALADLDGNLDARINALIEARVATLIANRIQPLEDGLADLQNNAASAAYILGVSNDTTNGRINFGGQQGMRGATAMCQATFNGDGNGEATAHFCSPDEVQRALSVGGYDDNNTGNFDNVETWTVSGLTVRHGTAVVYSGASDSLAASCNNLSYQSGDVATGVSLTVDIDSAGFGGGGNGAVSDIYRVRPARGCNTNMPVLCCR